MPQSLGYGSGMACWRRLRDWNANGVWQKLHQAILVRLREHDQIDWSRASIDGSSVPSPREAGTGPQPHRQRQARLQTTYRRRCQRHPAGDPRQRCQQALFERCMDAISAITGLPGRARKRPAKLHADKGYDYKRCRAYLRRRGIASWIARRGVESSEKLGKHRWVVERTHCRVQLYEVFCAVLYLLRSGCQWRMLPEEFPKWRTVHSYFAIWSEPREGGSLLEQVLKKSDWRGPRETGAQCMQRVLDHPTRRA